MILRDAAYTVTIPKNLKPGKYLIRTEVIMTASNPAQIYPECAQIEVLGDGTAEPSEEFLVSFPGAYKSTGTLGNKKKEPTAND